VFPFGHAALIQLISTRAIPGSAILDWAGFQGAGICQECMDSYAPAAHAALIQHSFDLPVWSITGQAKLRKSCRVINQDVDMPTSSCRLLTLTLVAGNARHFRLPLDSSHVPV